MYVKHVLDGCFLTSGTLAGESARYRGQPHSEVSLCDCDSEAETTDELVEDDHYLQTLFL